MKLKISIRKKRVTRSAGGDIFIFTLLAVIAVLMALPMVFMISSAFKPMHELWLYPPQFFVRNPTLQNFVDLFVLMRDSWVPMSRYFFNTVLLVVLGTGDI